jgi:HAD superfamily hydrolase (TIGR01549 family)
MIRAVFFDLDGTLKHNRPSGLEAFLEFSAELGLTLCADAQRTVERWTHAYWASERSNQAEASSDPEAFWFNFTRGMLQAAGVDDPSLHFTQAIERAFRERYQPERYIPDEAHLVLRTLRDENYTLGLVSNRMNDLAPAIAELGLDGYFHFTLSGGQAGAWKPDARIFLLACEMAQAAPDECVYVGDNFYADTLGAQAAGLTPVLLDPNSIFPEADCIRIARLGDLLSAISSQ